MTVIDETLLEQLRELIGGDHEILGELIGTFLGEGEEIVAGMEGALIDRDLERLQRAAHSLKSMALDFGARELSSLCASLESRCAGGWPASASADVAAIRDAFDAAAAELGARSGHGPAP